MAKLTFLGAAGTVTGSKHLLDTGSHRLLIDCGLFHGLKELRARNWEPLPIAATKIHTIVLTHAHLDHIGYLPRLVAQGFRGRVYCTPGTRDLATLVLSDAARIQEEDARDANRHGYSKHHPALPLYTTEDAELALTLLQPVGYNRPIPVLPDVQMEFLNAGHLLGSSYARITTGGQAILFGGDLGRYGRPVLPDPTPVTDADILLVESTYGNKRHDPDDGGDRLARLVTDVFDRGGKLIIPSFAIGRVNEVIYWLDKLEEQRRIPVMPVFVDSPMASRALDFYARHSDQLDPDMATGRQGVRAFFTKRMTMVASPQQSKEVVASKKPSIVIASSGMATGGRVLYHLRAALPDPRNTVLFVGYQAAGTRGRSLVDGQPFVRIKGMDVAVHAHIERLDSMSAHADADEILRWLGNFTRAPRMTYLVHGESEALNALKTRICTEKHWQVHVAVHQEQVEL
ncbi:MAG: MBL fold metallo-hydrolase [Acidimicrobiia bacterium]|nr:MBL fold metallo-hydrolase [Acidimicrobiia bacterium]